MREGAWRAQPLAGALDDGARCEYRYDSVKVGRGRVGRRARRRRRRRRRRRGGAAPAFFLGRRISTRGAALRAAEAATGRRGACREGKR